MPPVVPRASPLIVSTPFWTVTAPGLRMPLPACPGPSYVDHCPSPAVKSSTRAGLPQPYRWAAVIVPSPLIGTGTVVPLDPPGAEPPSGAGAADPAPPVPAGAGAGTVPDCARDWLDGAGGAPGGGWSAGADEPGAACVVLVDGGTEYAAMSGAPPVDSADSGHGGGSTALVQGSSPAGAASVPELSGTGGEITHSGPGMHDCRARENQIRDLLAGRPGQHDRPPVKRPQKHGHSLT
jgi:hypothetical protein